MTGMVETQGNEWMELEDEAPLMAGAGKWINFPDQFTNLQKLSGLLLVFPLQLEGRGANSFLVTTWPLFKPTKRPVFGCLVAIPIETEIWAEAKLGMLKPESLSASRTVLENAKFHHRFHSKLPLLD
ncbi:hypothetical protein COLO4_19836 [Corchorus olitorius]|uniref:Uncharacterized protein n=1 Tax=Corchorus olitorius TaxID=93759 RepID=A0A1R3J330_9ROSI|nr:hypothetical protein COLO4_19836 [Corchorus olitorius]